MSKKNDKVNIRKDYEPKTIGYLSKKYDVSKDTVRSLIVRLGYDTKEFATIGGKRVVPPNVVNQLDVIYDGRKKDKQLAVANERVKLMKEIINQQKETIEALKKLNSN